MSISRKLTCLQVLVMTPWDMAHQLEGKVPSSNLQ